MRCQKVRARLSAYRDGDLGGAAAAEVRAHLAACEACARHDRQLGEALEALADLPPLEPRESIAAAVLTRLEVESRGPGLALLFRPARMARPLILPSLVPACAVLVALVAGLLALGPSRGRAGSAGTWGVLPPSGSEGNPLPPVAEVLAPRVQFTRVITAAEAFQGGGQEDSLFVETVVARDGSVSAVNLLEGDSLRAAPVLAAMRQERFEPGRLNGRPVAVSVYRLFSRLDVRPPLT